MFMTQDNQRILNWLENEKKKDNLQEQNYKKKIIKEIQNLDKTKLFVTPKKLTLWQKIKMVVLGI